MSGSIPVYANMSIHCIYSIVLVRCLLTVHLELCFLWVIHGFRVYLKVVINGVKTKYIKRAINSLKSVHKSLRKLSSP